MAEKKKILKKAQVNIDLCVSCGCCVKACPRIAISIYKGMYAYIDNDKCVGCNKCVKICPASVIKLKEVNDETKKMV